MADALDVAMDDAHDAALDQAMALALHEHFHRDAEQLSIDEAVAYSLTLEASRRLLVGEDDEEDDEGDGEHADMDDADAAEMAHAEANPPPACTCCLSLLADAARCRMMPCGHVYCVPCVATLCRMGVRDRALVPSRCCQKEFPADYVKEALSQSEFAAYERFVDERQWTAHVALASDAEYAAAVKRLGWRQCPTCGVGVERISGCDAMKCLRGHHFCWGCGAAPCTCGHSNLAIYGFRG